MFAKVGPNSGDRTVWKVDNLDFVEYPNSELVAMTCFAPPLVTRGHAGLSEQGGGGRSLQGHLELSDLGAAWMGLKADGTTLRATP